MSGLDEKSVPSYGSLSLDELGRDVREAQIGHRDDFAFDQSYSKGHQMVGSINFNSLNRIVSKYAAAATTPSDVGEEPVAWRVRPDPGFAWVYLAGDPERNPAIRDYERQPVYSATALERVVRERDEAIDSCNNLILELAKVGIELSNENNRRVAAEAKLAEARKVIEPFAAIYDRCIPEEPELRGPILNAKPDEKALAFPLIYDLRAARRFLEETK